MGIFLMMENNPTRSMVGGGGGGTAVEPSLGRKSLSYMRTKLCSAHAKDFGGFMRNLSMADTNCKLWVMAPTDIDMPIVVMPSSRNLTYE